MKTLADLYLYISQASHAKKTFLSSEHGSLNYGQLDQRVKRITELFQEKNLNVSSRIVICSKNDEAVISYTIAALLNGITSIILPPEQKASRALSLIHQSHAQLIIIDTELEQQWQLEHNPKTHIISSNKTQNGSSLLNKFKRKTNSWINDIAQYTERDPALPVVSNEIAFINFSSGTTGNPKGIELSFSNIFTHMETLKGQFNYSEKSRILNNMMLAHVDGLFQGPILTLYLGASLYRPCNMDVQSIETYLNSIYQNKITHTITVPTILSFIDRLSSHNDYFSGDEFQHLISVAGMLNPELWQRLETRFNQRICNIYGLSETVAGGLFCGPSDGTYRRDTVGKPIDMKTRIVDNNQQNTDTNVEGELWLKGTNVFTSYFNNPQQTDASFSNGWFKTGDLAIQDDDGYIRICGRVKELIISGGFNIHPAEITEALLRHPDILDACAIGLKHDEWQEIAVAAVVLTHNSTLTEADIIKFSHCHLEPKKTPRNIHLLDSLPKGDAGKVKINELRKIIESKRINHESPLSSDSKFYDLVRDTLNLTPEQELSLSTRAEQLIEWDSLGHLNLMLAIEKWYQLNLSAQEIMSVETLNQAWTLIKNKTST